MARDLNSVVLNGRLVSEAKTGTTSGDKFYAKMRIAVNGFKENEVGFFDVTYWGKGAQAVAQYLEKGKQVSVQGRLSNETWEKDGEKHSKTVVVADFLQLLGGAVKQETEIKQETESRPAPKDDGYFNEEDIPY